MDFSSTEDVGLIISKVHERYPTAPIYLVGYSMGSIQAMLYLGKHAQDPDNPVKGFVAVSCPVDLAIASPLLSTKKLYSYFMTRSLKKLAFSHRELVEEKGGCGVDWSKLKSDSRTSRRM